MRGWVWLAAAKRWVGCGDMQDGMLAHYQKMVPLSDWAIEKKVAEEPVDPEFQKVIDGESDDGEHHE